VLTGDTYGISVVDPPFMLGHNDPKHKESQRMDTVLVVVGKTRMGL